MLGEQVRRFRWWHEAVLALLLVTLLVIAGVLMPTFGNLRSQLILSKHLWEMAILALAMTPIIITGGIDLSVGSIMGLCAVSFGLCHRATQSVALSCLACLCTGAVAGATNGMFIAKVRVHPLIVTLATYAAFRGIAEGLSQGNSYSRFGAGFAQLARGTLWGVPFPAFLFLAIAIVFGMILARTYYGRFIYAIGHNEVASRFSGVPVDGIKFSLYATSGLLTGLATTIYVSRFDTAKADAGMGFELDAITAVVIGGTSIFGGRGNIVGTVLGLLLIHEARQFVGRYWRVDELKSIMVGLLLISSVLAYRAVMPAKREE